MYPLRVLLFSFSFFLILSNFSQDPALFTSIDNGDWDDVTASTPWSITGTDSDGIPDSDDTIIVDHRITCSSSANSLIAEFRISTNGSIVLDPTYRLQVWGQNQNSTINGAGAINGPGLLNFVRSHTVSGTGGVSNLSLQINNWYN